MYTTTAVANCVGRIRQALQEEKHTLPAVVAGQLSKGVDGIDGVLASPSDEGWEIAVGTCLGCVAVLRHYKREIPPASYAHLIGELRSAFVAMADIICRAD